MILENDSPYNKPKEGYERQSERIAARRQISYTGLGKLPPQASDLEEAILGGILLERDAFLKVNSFLLAEHFYKDAHQKIFHAIARLFGDGKPLDILTLTQQLRAQGELEMIGGAYYITELTDRVASAANIEVHARIVLEKFFQRELIRIGTDTIQNAYEDTTDVLQLIEETTLKIFHLMNAQHGKQDKHIGAMIDDCLTELDTPAIGGLTGVGTGFKPLNAFNAGWQKGELTILAARPAMGKAQPLNSGVLTPTGFEEIGSLRIGDVICNSTGGVQQVTGVFPQGKKQTFTVKFNDGTETRCCDEHLWLTQSRAERKSHAEPSVKNLSQIRNSLTTGSDNRKNHSVRFTDPVFFKRRHLLLHPYLLGALLGDGCLTHLSITNPENDIIDRLSMVLPKGCAIRRKKSRGCPEYRIINTRGGRKNLVEEALKSLGLSKLGSADKIIPPEYLRTSYEDRLELLRGLLDTDGYVVDRHCIEYSTTSSWIKTGLIDLVRSLGGRATSKLKQGKYSKNGVEVLCKKYYRINISFTNDIMPVTSIKHQSRYKPAKNNLQKFITHVIPDKVEDCVCISVSSEDKLYVTDNYILTHNTALMMQWVRNAAVLHDVPVGVFSLEMSESQLIKRMVASETEIFLEKINKKTMQVWERHQVEQRVAKLRTAPIFIDDEPAITTTAFRSKCIRMKKKHNIGLFVVDYLQLMRGEMVPGQRGGNREQEIGMITRALKGIAKELDVPVIALSQLSRASESRPGGGNKPKLSDLRESGNIEQDADNVYFLYRPAYYGLKEDADGRPTDQMAELINAKHRNGATGSTFMKFRGAVMRFEDWDTQEALDLHPAGEVPVEQFVIKPAPPDEELPF